MKKIIAFTAMLGFCVLAQAQFAFELSGQVAYIDDGDTIILHPGSQRIRLAEIDAPETEHGASKPGQPYGQTARAALAAMMPIGSEVKARCYGRDAHNRAVCRLFYTNIDVSLEMVRLGHAHAYKEYIHDPRIIGAAEHAKTQQLGLWASGEAVYPQTWRRTCWEDNDSPLYCSNSESAGNDRTVLVAKSVPAQTTSTNDQQAQPREIIQGLTKYLTMAFELLKTVRLP